jgi:hypothetical protein
MDFRIITDEIQGKLEVTLPYKNLNLSPTASANGLILMPIIKACPLFISTGRGLKRVFTGQKYTR